MRGWILGVAVMLAAGPVLADDLPVAPPSPMIDIGSAPPVTRAPFAQTLHLGRLKFDIAEDRLDEVVKLIGAGTVGRMGDGGEVLFWVCYTLPHARLWLSAGESGRLDTVTAQMSNEAPSPNCPALPAGYQAVNLDGAIWLGAREVDLTKRLGAAGKSIGGWRVWRRELTLDKDKIDEDDGLAARVDGGKLVFVEMQRSRSW